MNIVIGDKEIPIDEVRFIRSEHKCSVIYYDGKSFATSRTLKKIHSEFPDLVKINHGILVNWDYVNGLKVQPRILNIIGGEELPISRSRLVRTKNRYKRD